MKVFSLIIFSLSILFTSATFAQTTSWKEPYKGDDVKGDHVLALWQFNEIDPTKDSSGNEHTLTLRGNDSHFVKDGKYGGGLKIESRFSTGDTRQGASLKDSKYLNLKGAFTLETWFSPNKAAFEDKQDLLYLIDKKSYFYSKDIPQANTGYLLLLRPTSKDQFYIEAQLGFGKDSEIIRSTPQKFEADKWYHIAFSYDGKGRYNFYLGNSNIGRGRLDNREDITPSKYKLTIGDRVNSIGRRFLGRIDEVRILDVAKRYVSGKVNVSTMGQRTAFYRMEKGAKMRLQIVNDTRKSIQNANVNVDVAGMSSQSYKIPNLPDNDSISITIPIDTRLRPDNYRVNIIVKDSRNGTLSDTVSFPLTIVPRELPFQMPIVMSSTTRAYEKVSEVGFTGILSIMSNPLRIWENGTTKKALNNDKVQDMRSQLDRLLSLNMTGAASIASGDWITKNQPKYNRIDRSGNNIEPANADALYPRVQEFSYEIGAAIAETFDDIPNWKQARINSEIRDRTSPSFNNVAKISYISNIAGKISLSI